MGRHSLPTPADSVWVSSSCRNRLEGMTANQAASAITVCRTSCVPPRYCRPPGQLLERRRRIHPQHPGFRSPRVQPAMRRRALKIKTVSGPAAGTLLPPREIAQFSAQHVEKLLAFMGVGFAAARLAARCETGAAPSPCFPTPAIPCARPAPPPGLCVCSGAPAGCSLPSRRKNPGCWSCKIAPACAACPPTRSSANVPARSGIPPRCQPLAPPEPGTSPRFARNWRKCEPMAPAPLPAVADAPALPAAAVAQSRRAFSPRTLRRKRARFSSFTSSAV